MSETSSLTSAKYIPTLLAANTWTNIILLMIKQRLTLRFNDSFFTRDTLNTDDGGTVSVDWFDEASALPDSAPVVIFLHTVSGSSREVINYTSEARRRGWRSCVLNRRGHAGMRLSSPRFNLMGDPGDTRMMKRFPDCECLWMVGVSAGSGLLIT